MKIRSSGLILIAFSLAAVSPFLRGQNSQVLIRSIRFEGNRNLGVQQLKSLLRLSREGAPYAPESLNSDLRRVETTYQDSGFLKARVEPPDVQVQSVQGQQVAAIRIGIVEGPLYRTGEIAVTGAQALSPGSIFQMCPLQKSQPYSRIKIAQWQSKIEEAYREMGYVRARCLPHERVHDSGPTVDCTLECVEGKPYTIGKITLTGDPSVNPVEFKRRLLFSEGGVFNPEMLVLTTQFLNASNLYEPISASDIQVRIDDEKGTVDISIKVIRSSGSDIRGPK